jgi:hypothetical protein
MQRPRSCKAFPAALLCLVALAFCPPSVAQEEDTGQPVARTALKAVKFIEVADIVDMVKMVGVDAAVDPKRKLVVLHGPDSKMQNALALIDALDTPEPPWGIELLVHLVAASRQPVDAPDLPAHLKTALAEVTELFGYRGFELIDTIFLFATTDTGSARVRAPVRDGAIFDVSFDRATVLYGEPKHSVSFENLSISAVGTDNVQLRTHVKVPEEHTVLIGKTGPQRAGEDRDLVLAIETRLKATWDTDG